jgi:hypothetical protein
MKTNAFPSILRSTLASVTGARRFYPRNDEEKAIWNASFRAGEANCEGCSPSGMVNAGFDAGLAAVRYHRRQIHPYTFWMY